MATVELEPLDFLEAIEFFRQKGYALSPDSWRDVWGAEHARAFTVARIAAMDLLEDIRAQIDKALAKGLAFDDFKRDFYDLLQRRGWIGTDDFPPWRVATIFRTNIQSAYQAGRYRQMLEVAEKRPYWMYDAVNDLRTRPSHAALDGKIFRFDHPFWDKFYPPNGFNCFPAGTLVLTPEGWKVIEQIKPQDRVIGGSYEEEPVSSVHANPFNGDLIRLILENGRIDTTPNHRVLTMRGWVRADGLNAGDVLVEAREVPPRDGVIRNVNDPDPQSGERRMAAPVEREPAEGFAFDRQVELWNVEVEPFGAFGSRDYVVIYCLVADRDQMREHGGFGPRRGPLRVQETWQVAANAGSLRGGVLFSCLQASRRGGGFEFLGGPPRALVLVLCFARPRVLAEATELGYSLAQLHSGLLSASGRRMDPLRAHGIGASPRGYSDGPEKPHEGPDVDAPPFAQLAIGELLPHVQTVEDLSDAPPLCRFDSMDSFRAWARSHARLNPVRSIERIPYNGIVFNLTVGCGSYIVQGATVHNCRCTVRTLSERDMERRGLKESTQPPAGVEPDPGFDYNVGLEAWRPDLSKYSPKARDLLSQLGIPRPKDIGQLEDFLNRLREAFAQTGIETSTRPLTLWTHTRDDCIAYTFRETGEIYFHERLLPTFMRVLEYGEIRENDEIFAFTALYHEFGHHLGPAVDMGRYEREEAFRYLSQAINELWARATITSFFRALGLKHERRALKVAMEGGREWGYDSIVKSLLRLLDAAGLDQAEITTLAANLNLSARAEELSDEIWSAIRVKRPDVDPSRWGHVGQVILREERLEAFIRALSEG